MTALILGIGQTVLSNVISKLQSDSNNKELVDIINQNNIKEDFEMIDSLIKNYTSKVEKSAEVESETIKICINQIYNYINKIEQEIENINQIIVEHHYKKLNKTYLDDFKNASRYVGTFVGFPAKVSHKDKIKKSIENIKLFRQYLHERIHILQNLK